MRRRHGLRAALVVHLFHDDVALELLRRIGRLRADVDVIATGPRPSAAVAAALAAVDRAEWIETPNEGFDVAPFLGVLPLLERRGYDLVGKLHTKKGNSGFGRRWREALLDALIGPDRAEAAREPDAVVAETIAAFAARPDLAMVGPAGLWLSAAMNMTANADGVRRLAAIAFPSRPLPADWGFFAGTMFWTRVRHLTPFAGLRALPDLWKGEGALRDGGSAHAIERLFGLVPLAAEGRTGLRAAGGGALRITKDGGAPVEILDALARLDRPDPAAELDRAERAFVRRHNPLLDYLAARRAGGDPHPLFANDWYAGRNAVPPDVPPLAHFIGLGAMAPDPSPLFRAAGYVRRRPWLKRRGENALRHYALAPDTADADPSPPARPHSPPDDPFARVARREQLRAFLRGGGSRSFAVKIAAARESQSEWGDVHFAHGLAGALAATGGTARVDFREDWYRRFDPPDVAIALRGPVRYEPRPESFNVLWIISHPDQVSFEEMAEYDLVYVASHSFAMLLRQWVDVPVLGLLQATDQSRFMPREGPAGTAGLFFAGNSRGQDRPVVRWAIELGLPLEIHGFGWSGAVPPHVLRGERIANAELPSRYAAATAVIGDHWPAMADFGFVSNRVFDVLAAGGTPITDAFPAIGRAVGKAAITIEARDGLAAAVATAAARPRARRLADAERIRRDHGFAARASTIETDIAGFPSGDFARRPAGRGPRVHVVAEPGDARAEWMVARRLLGPLTTDHAGLRSLSRSAPADRLPPADIVIAVPGPAATAAAWERIAAAAESRRLVVDAGALGGTSRRPPPRLQPLFAAAADVWWPDEHRPRKRTGRDRFFPDSVDPRLWRDYHRASRWAFATAPLRCVLVAPEGVGARRAAILAEAFAGDRATLTILGPPPSVPGPWTSVPLPFGKSAYAACARWLRGQAFHAGLCLPGPCGDRDVDLAFLDFSALGLLSIAPPALTDRAIESRALVVPVAADLSDLAPTLRRLAAAPARYAGLAAASSDYVFAARSAAAAGTMLRDLLA
ncbi:MAG: rhamnan synthesis F family protein [Bauldia sp.]